LPGIILALGPLRHRVPLNLLQLAIGILLLLFGMRWLGKAILRAEGVIMLHDEASTFADKTAELREEEDRRAPHLDLLAGFASFMGPGSSTATAYTGAAAMSSTGGIRR
jgi:uncharacterized membrane protein